MNIPPLHGVMESVLYAEDLEAARIFYSEVLNLKNIFQVPGRQLVFRIEDRVVLIFDPRTTQAGGVIIEGSPIPRHGARGAGHIAFLVEHSEINSWRGRLQEKGVAIESEVKWPNGAHSVYFRDPAGNSLEFVTGSVWNFPPASGPEQET